VLASLIGFLGDFDLAEEVAQEAFAIAAERWPVDGAPGNPGAWLLTTARNRAFNRIRRDRTLVAKTRLLQYLRKRRTRWKPTSISGERLELIFTCCHSGLAMERSSRSPCGRWRPHHGRDRRAFLVARRRWPALVRAKQQDQGRGDPFRVPAERLCPSVSPPCSQSST